MKIRIFSDMVDDVYRIIVCTEDWSQGDFELMCQYGEPEINVGGDVTYDVDGDGSSSSEYTKKLGDQFIRILHGFPYARGFDARDYGSDAEAIAIGTAWKGKVVSAIRAAVSELRAKQSNVQTEEIENV